jgi:hypothetical protein
MLMLKIILPITSQIAILPSVILLNVMAPFKGPKEKEKCLHSWKAFFGERWTILNTSSWPQVIKLFYFIPSPVQ